MATLTIGYTSKGRGYSGARGRQEKILPKEPMKLSGAVNLNGDNSVLTILPCRDLIMI